MNKSQILIKQLTNSGVVLFLLTVKTKKHLSCLLRCTPYLCGPDLRIYGRCSYKTRKQLWESTFLKDCEAVLKNN